MKPTTLPPTRPHSRRAMDRMRRQRMAIAALAWIAIIAGATAAAYIITTKGVELQFSLQIKP